MAYSDEVLADSPTVYLKCDDASGNLTDSSGNGHTATAAGTPGYGSAGPMTGALAVDTTSGDFSVADHADVDLGNGPFTIEFWWKRTADSGAGYIFGKTNSSLAATGYCGELRNGTTDTIRLQTGDTSTHVNNSGQLFNDTNWHYGAFTRASATNAKVYVDGTTVAQSTSAKTFSDNALAFVIGALYSGNSRFPGLLSRVALYKSELSAARIAIHYNATSAGDASGGSVTGAAALTADASLTVTASVTRASAASLSGAATLTAAASVASAVRASGASLTAEAILSVTASPTMGGVASLSAEATLAGTPSTVRGGAAALSGTATLAVAATASLVGAASLSAEATLTAVGASSSDTTSGPPPVGTVLTLKVGR